MDGVKERMQTLEINDQAIYLEFVQYLASYFPDWEERMRNWDQSDYTFYAKTFCTQKGYDPHWFLLLA